jgi:hypothetical protein
MKKIKPARIKAKRYVIDWKSMHPCMDCGIQHPYYCMEFDHVRGRKRFEMWRVGYVYTNLKTIQDEIDKCDVVCRNCHAKRTFMRNLDTNDELQDDSL